MPKGTHITTWNHRRKFMIHYVWAGDEWENIFACQLCFCPDFCWCIWFWCCCQNLSDNCMLVGWCHSPPPPIILGGHSNLAWMVSITPLLNHKMFALQSSRTVPCSLWVEKLLSLDRQCGLSWHLCINIILSSCLHTLQKTYLLTSCFGLEQCFELRLGSGRKWLRLGSVITMSWRIAVQACVCVDIQEHISRKSHI